MLLMDWTLFPNETRLSYAQSIRTPLVLSEGMKLFAVNAGYRKTDVGTNWYYVRAKNAREARKRFKDRITWLDVYGIREVTDAALIQDVLSSPRKYICF